MNPIQRAEVEWYRQYGRHPERITRDSFGEPYVIGDSSWNRSGRPNEVIEPLMQRAYNAGGEHD